MRYQYVGCVKVKVPVHNRKTLPVKFTQDPCGAGWAWANSWWVTTPRSVHLTPELMVRLYCCLVFFVSFKQMFSTWGELVEAVIHCLLLLPIAEPMYIHSLTRRRPMAESVASKQRWWSGMGGGWITEKLCGGQIMWHVCRQKGREGGSDRMWVTATAPTTYRNETLFFCLATSFREYSWLYVSVI